LVSSKKHGWFQYCINTGSVPTQPLAYLPITNCPHWICGYLRLYANFFFKNQHYRGMVSRCIEEPHPKNAFQLQRNLGTAKATDNSRKIMYLNVLCRAVARRFQNLWLCSHAQSPGQILVRDPIQTTR